VRAVDIRYTERTSTFDVLRDGERLGELTVGVPGEHNMKNALAAVTVGLEIGVPFSAIASALVKFTGVYRRFEVKGEPNGILVVDDYAHHPTEVRATLDAIRNGWSRRVIALFQPHTYTRTRDFYEDFAKALFHADVALVTDVYPARERPIQGIDGEMIVRSAIDFGHRDVHYIADRAALVERVLEIVHPGDIVVTMGAGDIWKSANELVEALASRVELAGG
jgi:UDP-N-acetylmuramate--alanine ligase